MEKELKTLQEASFRSSSVSRLGGVSRRVPPRDRSPMKMSLCALRRPNTRLLPSTLALGPTRETSAQLVTLIGLLTAWPLLASTSIFQRFVSNEALPGASSPRE